MTDRQGVWSSSWAGRARRLAWLWLAVVALCCSTSFAQSGAGAIQGTVSDPTGAVVPGATVHIVNTATGQANDTVSNSTGFYSVQGLFAGQYRVTFAATGMKQYESTVDLEVAQTAVINAALSLGAITDKVTVSAETQQLANYESGTIGTDLDNARINELPMNGRNLMTLTGMTTPGLEAGGTRANGLMSPGIEYVQDGAPVTNRDNGGPGSQADPDAIQEVRIETSASNAMYATPATAVITTKSGTNDLHGSAFETARNNAIGVAKSRSNPSNFVAPRLIRNEFGASVGGPIEVPFLYHGRNKSFFFFAYERYSLRSGTYSNSSVPTTAERNGDFSDMINGNGLLDVIYDPSTTGPAPNYVRTAFPDNKIPTNEISPLAKALFAITPAPTNSNDPLLQSNISYPATSNTTAPTITTRLDHAFNEKNNAYVRYTYYDSNAISAYSTIPEPATIAGAGMPANAANLIDGITLEHMGAVGYTHVFSPTFTSQTVLGNTWMTTWANRPPGNATQNYESMLGLPNNFGESGFPEILGPTYEFGGGQVLWGGPMIITNLDENLTKTLGRHQLFFGGRYRHERLGILPDRTADQFDFTSQTTALYNPATGTSYGATPNTGITDADFYLGSPYYYSVRLNPPYEHWVDQEFDAYIQDDYHVSNKLTLNLGLRWEAHPVAQERSNLINGFDVANDAVVLGEPASYYIAKGYTTQAIITNLQNIGVKFESPSQAGLPPHLVYGNNAIFDPRIGVAYAPWGTGHGTVLRAGFGRYSYPIPLRNFYATAKTNEPFAGVYYQNYELGSNSPDGKNNYLLRAPQPVVAGQNSANVVNSSTTNAIAPGISELAMNPHFPPNMVTNADLTVEQPLKPSSVLRVSYAWERATNLDQEYEFNNPPSTYVWEKQTGTAPPQGNTTLLMAPYDQKSYTTLIMENRTGYTNYNAIQANYQRLYKNGYAYQIYYVYARSYRVGGNAFRDGIVYPYQDYAPGTFNTKDYALLNRQQNYGIDSAIPEHHISFNGLVDLPVGRHKKYLGNSPRWLDEIIGGYQIAYDGNVTSQYFQPSSSNWGGVGTNPLNTGSRNPLHVWGKKYKVTDCSSGTCYPGRMWFNGFISPLLYQNPCTAAEISGLPSSYQPFQTPINVDPGTITCNGTTASASNAQYLTNNVPVTLSNGSTQTVAYSPGPSLNPYTHTFLHGPFDWSADASLFKVFPITEKANLRVNVDAFNVFNVQGDVNPSSNGIMYFRSSYNTPRQIQITARLTF